MNSIDTNTRWYWKVSRLYMLWLSCSMEIHIHLAPVGTHSAESVCQYSIHMLGLWCYIGMALQTLWWLTNSSNIQIFFFFSWRPTNLRARPSKCFVKLLVNLFKVKLVSNPVECWFKISVHQKMWGDFSSSVRTVASLFIRFLTYQI